MVRVLEPFLAAGEEFTVRVVPVAELAGLKLAVTLNGRPVTENVTVPVKPPTGFTVMA